MLKTVLVVEDEPLNIKLLKDVLRYAGHAVIEAVNGQEGVDLAIANKPDIILMDIQLPIMDGMEATRILKANPDTRNIPIIALTGYAMTGDENRMREAGCDGYLSKPFKVAELLRMMNSMSGQNSAGDA